eukprot:XP_011430859.1 PREDICTED: GRIP and coiled-coil domain-containing protein 2-like [Crassostrea gigas]
MADHPPEGGTPMEAEGGAKSPAASKLDNLSRDDLTKFVKKQMLLLQKTRAKCDELAKKVTQLESQREGSGENDDPDNLTNLKTKVKELEEEKQEMLTAYNAVQTSQELAANKLQVQVNQTKP